MDPYRNSFEGRVTSVEKRLREIEKRKNLNERVVISAFKRSLAERLDTNEIWYGALILLIVAMMFGTMPFCLAAIHNTAEEIRAKEETRQTQQTQHEQGCQALNMQFIGYFESHYELTCGNENMIVIIDLDDEEVDIFHLNGINFNFRQE